MLSAALLLWSTSVAKPPAAKLSASVSQEMQDAIVAVNKALGLESWPSQGIKPCVDRGGDGSDTKDVSAKDARACASTALQPKLAGLGRDYVLAILMAPIGPVTAVAFGTGEAAGFGAYSCDPDRKCRPVRLDPGNKWGKRLLERQARACSEPDTIWFPADARVCPAGLVPASAAASQPPAGDTSPPPQGAAQAPKR